MRYVCEVFVFEPKLVGGGRRVFRVVMSVGDIVPGLATVMRMTDCQNTAKSCRCRRYGGPRNRSGSLDCVHTPRYLSRQTRCQQVLGKPIASSIAYQTRLVRTSNCSSSSWRFYSSVSGFCDRDSEGVRYYSLFRLISE